MDLLLHGIGCTLCRYRHNVHLLRDSFKYASKRDWAQLAKDLKPVYTAPSEAEALDRFAEFNGKCGKRYLAIIRLWENACAESAAGCVPIVWF